MAGLRREYPLAFPATRRFQILTTDDFVDDLHHQLRSASSRVAIQLMTFDGDDAGQPVAELLIEAAARGVRVELLIDSFALRFVSDQMARRPAVRVEYNRTLDMYQRLKNNGVDLRFTNPNGPFRLFSAARNHKKLFAIDDVSYLGGVNVSDHNFAWHDFMVKVSDDNIHQALLEDFASTFDGVHQVVEQPILTNEAIEQAFDELVSTARRRVIVASPYAVDRRLANLLEHAPAFDKQVIVATENNFRYLQAITPYVTHRLARAGARLSTYRSFSHAKFVLADDRLLVGSSNFGCHSFWCNQEIGLLIDDPAFIAEFSALMLDGLVPVEVRTPFPKRWLGWVASVVMVGYLRAYARLIVPRVPPLRTVPENHGRWARLTTPLGERAVGRRF
ncbi:MAG: phosphatidylserine/phosphatidylglycerophosphate/cardiolipin synthase family protein [Actinomycetia bacterium]|nr:phosphatidylserine/phosphatidylglycerophosphate/cardiolipin synthase family protein [Actinomycetes bacterium]